MTQSQLETIKSIREEFARYDNDQRMWAAFFIIVCLKWPELAEIFK